MRSARERALDAIKAGDVIMGIAENGKDKLLLVYETDESRIFARHVTSQTKIEFGRDGKSRKTWDGGTCTIVSTARLPVEDYEVVVGFDRKRQQAKAGVDQRLTKSEIRLILTYGDFFRTHLLPDADPT